MHSCLHPSPSLICLQMRGLYKGMAAPMYGVTPIFAICFWAYDLSKQVGGERVRGR